RPSFGRCTRPRRSRGHREHATDDDPFDFHDVLLRRAAAIAVPSSARHRILERQLRHRGGFALRSDVTCLYLAGTPAGRDYERDRRASCSTLKVHCRVRPPPRTLDKTMGYATIWLAYPLHFEPQLWGTLTTGARNAGCSVRHPIG